jgi:hypothetical protein
VFKLDGQTGLLIVYIVFGFFGFVLMISGIVIFILWRRRKLSFTNFLNENGQWERESWKPNELRDTFIYDKETYKYDIRKATRDKINRPVAHYYKGNPEQLEFDHEFNNKRVVIGTKEITGKDFHVLMLSKVLRDIFQDEEVMNMLWMLLIINVIIGIVTIILVITHNPDVVLKYDNQTINIIADGVRKGLSSRVV